MRRSFIRLTQDDLIPLSSCLSVSTLTNFTSVSSSARDWKIGPTSCKNTVSVKVSTTKQPMMSHLAWTTPFCIEVNNHWLCGRLLYDVQIKLIYLTFYHIFQEGVRPHDRRELRQPVSCCKDDDGNEKKKERSHCLLNVLQRWYLKFDSIYKLQVTWQRDIKASNFVVRVVGCSTVELNSWAGYCTSFNR